MTDALGIFKKYLVPRLWAVLVILSLDFIILSRRRGVGGESTTQKLLRRYADEADAKRAMAKLMAAMARRGYDFESARRAVEQALDKAQEE